MPFNFREAMSRARKALHDIKSEKAVYTPAGSTVSRDITVRIFREGYFQGGGESLPEAGYESNDTVVLFLVEDVESLGRGDTVVLDASGESFTVGFTEPPDGPTVRAAVAPT